jgi:predicted amidohydrolase YtcJ
VIRKLWAVALLAACAAPPAPEGAEGQAANWIFRDGPIVSLDGGPPVAALAVAGGRIGALGELDAVMAHRGPDTVVFDLDGRALAPAFVDHHVHLLNLGLSLLEAEAPSPAFIDLAGLASPEAIAAEVAARAARVPAGEWILGKGWSQGAWGAAELPDHAVLSAAAPDHPVFLARADGHAGWVNTAALGLAGIDGGTADPPGGAIRRRADRSPSGVLLERANELVRAWLPEPSDERVRRAFRLATEALAAQGVTEVYDAGFLGPPGVVDLSLDLGRYARLLAAEDRAAPLPLRVHLMVPAPSDLAARIAADPEPWRQLSPRVGVTHFKLFADGALGSRGGWLSAPYSDDPTTSGVQRMTRQEIETQAAAALDAGLDVATHAIGDAAVGRVLDVYAALLAARPGLDPARLRIEHLSLASAADLERAGRLGVVLSVNPDFVAPDDAGRAMEDGRLGAERSQRVYALGSLARHGGRLAFGSDYFTTPFAPLFGFYTATTRKNADGLPPDGWHPAERLDRLESLRVQTRLWPAGGGAPRRGRLAEGATADLVVLSEDPLTVPEAAILDIAVDATMLGGELTYEAEP